MTESSTSTQPGDDNQPEKEMNLPAAGESTAEKDVRVHNKSELADDGKETKEGKEVSINRDEDEKKTDEKEESIHMARMMLNLQDKEDRRSSELFHKLDTDNSDTASHEEMAEFLATNHSLWATLSLNFGVSKKYATRVATEVAMSLATGCNDRSKAMEQQLSEEQFKKFRKYYILDKAGQQEFFYRAVFATFDRDKTNALNEEELDSFLNIFYLSGGVFQGKGDLELPHKDRLRQLLMEKFDTNNDNKIQFEEVQQIIKTADGSFSRLSLTSEMETIIKRESSHMKMKTAAGEGEELGHEESIHGEEEGNETTAEEDSNILNEVTNPPTTVEKSQKEESIHMARMMLNLQDKEDRRSSELFHKLDTDNSDTASHEEMAEFLATNHSLWAMLSLNFGVSKKYATRVATEVAMSLATGCNDRSKAMEQQLSEEQFKKFRKRYILDKAGQQEFFYRAVFATFDRDKTNALNEEELDSFLNIFYLSGGVFQGQGDLELPPKKQLRQLLMEKFDTNNDKKIQFEEVQQIIKTADGSVGRLSLTDEMTSAILMAESKEAVLEVDEDKFVCVVWEWILNKLFGEQRRWLRWFRCRK